MMSERALKYRASEHTEGQVGVVVAWLSGDLSAVDIPSLLHWHEADPGYWNGNLHTFDGSLLRIDNSTAVLQMVTWSVRYSDITKDRNDLRWKCCAVKFNLACCAYQTHTPGEHTFSHKDEQ